MAISLHVENADQVGQILHVDVYGGTPDSRTTHIFYLEIPPESATGWARVEIPWVNITRAEWEADPNTPINPAYVTGIGFGFGTPENASQAGRSNVD